MRMTIGQLRQSMTPGEYLAWSRYHTVRAIEKNRARGIG